MADAHVKRERTCIGCGKQSGKGELMRVVRMPDGGVAFDQTGRAAGRGAYLCSKECLAIAVKGNKLQRALKVAIGHDDVERISAQLSAAFAGEETR